METMNLTLLKTMRALLCILSTLLLISCAGSQKVFSSEEPLEGVETILVMPFQNLYEIYGDKVHIDCTFCNRRHVVGEMPEGTAEFMTDHLKNLLMNDRAYRFVYPEQMAAPPTMLQADKNGVVRMSQLVATVGDTDTVDAILVGYLFHFKERVGTRYSVESPASVSFSLFLTRVSDGRIVWRGVFEETQQALSENLLKLGAFIKRKGRWVTVRKLAADGLEDMLLTFPKP
jgi:hypothetical protein